MSRFVALGGRLLRGRTGRFPRRCSMPMCRAPLGYWSLRVSQGERLWAFCGTECLSGFVRLCGLPDVHADEMADMAWAEERGL